MARRVTRTALHVLTLRTSEPPAPARVTRAALHVLVRTPPAPDLVTPTPPPATATSGRRLPTIVAEVVRGGLRDVEFNGILRAQQVSGNPVISGVLEVQAVNGRGVFNGIRVDGEGPIEIEIDAPDDPTVPVITLPEIEILPGTPGGPATRTTTSMSTFRR